MREQKNSEGDVQDFRTYLKGSVTNQCGTGRRLDNKENRIENPEVDASHILKFCMRKVVFQIQLAYLINNARVTGRLGKKLDCWYLSHHRQK